MNNSKYHLQLGDTTSCTKRITEEKNYIGQRDVKGNTKDFFIVSSPKRIQ